MNYQSITIDGGSAFPVVETIRESERGTSVILDRWPFGRKTPKSYTWMPVTLVDQSGAEVRARVLLGDWERTTGGRETCRVELHIRPEVTADV